MDIKSFLFVLMCFTTGTFATFSPSFSVLQAKNLNDSLPKSLCAIDLVDSNATITEDYYSFHSNMSVDLCNAENLNKTPIDKGYFLFTYNHNCSSNDQLINFKNLFPKSVGIVFVIKCDLNVRKEFNFTSDVADDFNISISLIEAYKANQITPYHELRRLRKAIDVKCFSNGVLFNIFLAFISVFVGSLWSGHFRKLLYFNIYKDERSSTNTANENAIPNNQNTENIYSSVSPTSLYLMAFTITTTMFMLYYFYKYLVPIFMIFYLLWTLIALYICLKTLFSYLLPRTITKAKLIQIPPIPNIGTISISYFNIVCFSIAISLPISWFVYRFYSFSWILQDIMGCIVIIVCIRFIQFPSFKFIASLLLFLFFYDIFFVFITPFIFGESIMEIVATGNKDSPDYLENRCSTKSATELPIAFKSPAILFGHYGSTTAEVCFSRVFSMLGFGDAAMPGILIAYTRGYDNIYKTSYFIVAFVAYIFGLLESITALCFMKIAQPALLYIVPTLFLPLFVVSYCRKDFKRFWNGPPAFCMDDRRESLVSES